jgi:hypothetical protein
MQVTGKIIKSDAVDNKEYLKPHEIQKQFLGVALHHSTTPFFNFPAANYAYFFSCMPGC